MTSLPRLLSAILVLTVSFALPLRAYTLEQMKEMEGKVKGLVSKNMPAVVSLIGEKTSGAGSGVVVSADGLILTAAHVTRGNEEMIVIFPDGKQMKCKVLGANYDRDVGLAKITAPGTYPFCAVGDSDKLEATTIVVGLGHPGGYDVRRTPPVRIGRISLKDMGGFLVSDCTLISGDSGGPLFDLDGKVVGIHSSISESLSFNRDAPVNAAKADWDKLIEGKRWGKLPGPQPGPPGQRDTGKPVLGAVFDPRSKHGAVLKEVQPKSPLESAGLTTGDIILSLGGEDMKTGADVTRKVASSTPGDKLDIVYRRYGREKTATVTLISAAEMLKRMDSQPGGNPAPAPPKKDTPPAPAPGE
jgi:serine protease Do